jgi:hypothetical protein
VGSLHTGFRRIVLPVLERPLLKQHAKLALSPNPDRGKKSYQPILTFLAETREYVAGGLRIGDRPTGKQIADHLQQVFAWPEQVQTMYARADSGFHCWAAVEAYERRGLPIDHFGPQGRPLGGVVESH